MKIIIKGKSGKHIGESFEQHPCAYEGEREIFIFPWYHGQEIETIIEN